MSIVFDYLQRRLAEKGSEYWKSTPMSASLVLKTDKDIDESSLTISGTNLKEISGENYSSYKVSGNAVYEINGKIVYDLDDLLWEKVSVSCDGVLLSTEDKPLIYIDFGFKRLAENGEFKVTWGDSGVLFLETSSNTTTSNNSSSSTTVIQNYGIEEIQNSSDGVGVFARIVNKVAYLKTLMTDKWLKLTEENDKIKISINTDFLIEGKNVKLTKNEDGSVVIDVEVSNDNTSNDSTTDDVSTQVVIDVSSVSATLEEHINDSVIHITNAEREHWNSLSGISEVDWKDVKNTPTTISEYGISDAYTKSEVDSLVDGFEEHIENTVIHVTQEDKTFWNSLSASEVDWEDIINTPTTVSGYGIVDVYTKTEVNGLIEPFEEHLNDSVIHVTQEDKNFWNSLSASEVDWKDIINTPTTVSGYGITDAYTKTEVDGLIEPFEEHLIDDVIHVTQNDKNLWNSVSGKVEKYIVNVGIAGQNSFSINNPTNSTDISYTVFDNILNCNVGISLTITSENISASDLRTFQQDNQLKIIINK